MTALGVVVLLASIVCFAFGLALLLASWVGLLVGGVLLFMLGVMLYADDAR